MPGPHLAGRGTTKIESGVSFPCVHVSFPCVHVWGGVNQTMLQKGEVHSTNSANPSPEVSLLELLLLNPPPGTTKRTCCYYRSPSVIEKRPLVVPRFSGGSICNRGRREAARRLSNTYPNTYRTPIEHLSNTYRTSINISATNIESREIQSRSEGPTPPQRSAYWSYIVSGVRKRAGRITSRL